MATVGKREEARDIVGRDASSAAAIHMRKTVRSKFRSGAARHAFDGYKGSVHPWYSKLLQALCQRSVAGRGLVHS